MRDHNNNVCSSFPFSEDESNEGGIAITESVTIQKQEIIRATEVCVPGNEGRRDSRRSSESSNRVSDSAADRGRFVNRLRSGGAGGQRRIEYNEFPIRGPEYNNDYNQGNRDKRVEMRGGVGNARWASNEVLEDRQQTTTNEGGEKEVKEAPIGYLTDTETGRMIVEGGCNTNGSFYSEREFIVID